MGPRQGLRIHSDRSRLGAVELGRENVGGPGRAGRRPAAAHVADV